MEHQVITKKVQNRRTRKQTPQYLVKHLQSTRLLYYYNLFL